MKPAAFEYLAPESVAEAVAALARHGANAKILAGGQSLVPVLNFRLGRYDVLIDINRIAELAHITVDDATLRIGAMTRQRDIETSPLVGAYAPLLAEATHWVAHLPIRTRGTIGGSIAHADPSAEYPAVMLALEAQFVVRDDTRQRMIAARDFFRGPLDTALQPNELLEEVRIPARQSNEGFAFEEVSRRHGDFAIIGMACALKYDASRITQARLAVCGLESGAVRLDAAERVLEGGAPSSASYAQAAKAACGAVSAQSDLHASAEYRLHLLEVLLPQIVERAVRDAGGVSG